MAFRAADASRAAGLAQAYPTGMPHTCFPRETVRLNREVVAELGEYDPHSYRPSGATQSGAVGRSRAQCRTRAGAPTLTSLPPAAGLLTLDGGRP